MSRKLETIDRKVAYVLGKLGIPVKRRHLLKILYELEKQGANLGLKIEKTGSSYFSPTVDEILNKLVERGYIKLLYTIDKRFYGGMYTEVYSPTEKIERILRNPKFSKKDKMLIDKYIEELLTSISKKK